LKGTCCGLHNKDSNQKKLETIKDIINIQNILKNDVKHE